MLWDNLTLCTVQSPCCGESVVVTGAVPSIVATCVYSEMKATDSVFLKQ